LLTACTPRSAPGATLSNDFLTGGDRDFKFGIDVLILGNPSPWMHGIWSEEALMQIVPQILPFFKISNTRLLALRCNKKLTHPYISVA